MPLDCNEKLNPYRLKRDGVHQGQRLLPALDPSFAKVDEREPAHWMVFASRYAQYLHFFENTDTQAGNWEPFFQNDPALYMATAAIQDVDAYKIRLQELTGFLLDLGNKNDDLGLRQAFGNLLNCAGTLAWQLEQLQKALPENVALKAVLKNLITSQLAPAFARLIRYYKAALASADVDLSAVPQDWEILGASIVPFDLVLIRSFSTDWTDGVTDWATFSGALTADAAVFGNPLPATTFERLNHAASHNLFTSIFDQFLKAYARSVAEAKRSLEAALNGQDDHQPHYALFLAFLRLLSYARDHANSLTARHLDYYYREILQLKTKPAIPNEAHILVELSKHLDSYLLPAGALLKAGKDSLGKDVFYKLVEDFVANKAKVAELKSVFHYTRHPNDKVPASHDGRLFASPVANSADGLGAELLTPDKQWHPFASKVYENEKLAEINMPHAQLGFAVASHYLYLREGSRTVILSFKINNLTLPEADFSEHFNVELTGEKGWIKVQASTLIVKDDSPFQDLKQTFNLIASLPGDAPATAPYSSKIHGGNFGTSLPIAKITLRHGSKQFLYNALAGLELAKMKVITFAAGLKDLAISNDFGDLDASKPFQPFGALPIAGASLVVGCKELFQKQHFSMEPITILPTLRIQWKALPNRDQIFYESHDKPSTTPPDASLQFLDNGVWTGQGANPNFALFPIGGSSQVLTGFPPYVNEEPDFSEKQYFSVNSKNSFFRLRLNKDFGHKKHLEDTVYFVVNKTNQPDFAPYTPVIEEITLNYWAEQDIDLGINADFANRKGQFFHLYPFGHVEAHAALDEKKQLTTLLPRFIGAPTGNDPELCLPGGAIQPTSTGVPPQSEAEFYIGVADLQPPQNLALLFQLAEGSANPKTLKPADHVQWSYLSKNKWVALKKDEVNDRTGQLIRSGIITLTVPRGANSDNTLLPAGMHWLRASIAKQEDENGVPIPTTSDAVCKIVRVAAQATRAVFSDNANAPDFLQSQLPAGTIAKLLEPKAEVKKVEHPFPTFGGRPAEQPAHFYTRISERLRHKNRAVTVWDYERLVLEAFPHIYKVKCLNHTLFTPTETGFGKYNELAPGHVTLIAIPNLRNHNAIDPLRPYVSLGDLEAVADFLKKHLSCHVNLHVHNPVFEPVRVEFCVKFHPGTDEAFHLKLLKTEITRFLSPWAFEEGRAISFGGRMFKSSLINFVEERPYVDYLTDFQMFHLITDTSGKDWSKIDLEEIEASTAISILVSASAEAHTVKAIPATETDLAGERYNC